MAARWPTTVSGSAAASRIRLIPRAALLFRPNRHYRADAFTRGLERHGYAVARSPLASPQPTDLLVIWNRTRQHERIALLYEQAGARVIVAENGYLDRLGSEKHYALALGHHNGAGSWFVGDRPRFEIEQEPVARPGGAVLVLPQRGIGEKGVAMPGDWARSIQPRLARITARPIIIRRHPGIHGLRRPLEDDLAKAHCVVTWASGAAIKAIRAGLPCFYEMDGWIGNCSATRLADQIEQCDTPNRGELWRRVTWAQWTMAEIECGEAFDGLIHAEGDHLFCARQPPIKHDRAGHGGGHPGLRGASGGQPVHCL